MKLQPYIIVQQGEDKIRLCCMKCGKLSEKIEVCNHKVKSGDSRINIDRRKIRLK